MKYEAAKKLVSEFINLRLESDEDEFVIDDEEVIETDFGWVFPYNSKKFLESGELIYALVGNAPIIFDNRDETIHITGTSHDVDYYIDQHKTTYIP
ncbi:MAG: hypothetical protein B0A82_01415 [Alkalinema sp. CACIAM 70d]|nr:MAG: hypothetical protein B0A82_01415 [Alkalinema sp. CACIAM 70d]